MNPWVWRLLRVAVAGLFLALVLHFTVYAQPAAAAPTAEQLLQGAERIGAGRVAAYRRGGNTLVVLPPGSLGKPMVWYTEVVGVPSGMVTNNGLGIADSMVRLERVGNVVHVRDLSTTQKRRASAAPLTEVPGSPPGDPKRRPIDVALHASETGALIASFPVLAVQADGALVIDVTATFSNDIPAVTGRKFVAESGVMPAAVDASKSYIDSVRVRGEVLNIRSHITYLVALPKQPAVGPQQVSIVLGHSLVFLPDKPMAARPGDPRVGYFPIEYTEFEPDRDSAQASRTLVPRFRLEKANPSAAVSDPIKPITYYLGRGIPERWKPYIRAGVLQWLPVFEAAGFSNAIRVLDAPTPAQDPTWSPEDVTINVIRWVTEERVNAMGPHVSDPRSGETLSAHIQIWPTVIDGFSQYYWAMFGGGVDPGAPRLPLSIEKAGALLSYIVAHEVGHTLGLMHNHIASTAYPVAQMRDPAFANRHGPNSSIMAYGRFNQAAQPGDGVTQLWSVMGPYDYAAIKYGYGVFGTDPQSERRELAAFAETFSRDRRLFWATSEPLPSLIERFGRDPRVQTENTGAERVEATRLGVANLLRSLGRLDAATAGDAALFASTYNTALSRHVGLLKSVSAVVAGVMPALGAGDGPTARFVPAAEQRQAVRYLLGEGAASLEPYAAPAVVERVSVYGGYRTIDRVQAAFVGDLINGPTVAVLESQVRRDPSAYSSLDLGRDVSAAVWGALGPTTPTARALQRGYLDTAHKMIDAWAKAGDGEAAQAAALQAAYGLSDAAARTLVESGDDTVFASWLRTSLPPLRTRLQAAARRAGSEADRLHYADMATQVERLSALGKP